MKKLTIATLALMLMLGAIPAAAQQNDNVPKSHKHNIGAVLTARSTSATSMTNCGRTDPKKWASDNGYTTEYVTKGGEKVVWVTGCKDGAQFTDSGHSHTFAAGVKLMRKGDRGFAVVGGAGGDGDKGCANNGEAEFENRVAIHEDDLEEVVPKQPEKAIDVTVTVNNYIQVPTPQPQQVIREYIQPEATQAVAQKSGGKCGMKCGMLIGGAIGFGATYAAMHGRDRGDNIFLVSGGNATAIATGGNSSSGATANANGQPVPPPSRTIPTKETNGGVGSIVRGDQGRGIASNGGAPFGQTPTPVDTHHAGRPVKTLIY